jgi:DNA mismatch repair protein MutL
MSDIIHLLPDSIANQIAAGEVIQRPSSVVKELMENAIDAGSTEIQLILKDAGKTLIQVIDNGSGMSEMDARMAFERHATSKIKTASDLFKIKTMGFRGEALASIASISHVELKTIRPEMEVGTRIQIIGSVLEKQEPVQIVSGTHIAVKNLFFNVPARRKFLKSDPVELRHIIDEFTRISLSNPHIHFSCYHNEKELYHLSQGNLRQRIVALFGKKINELLIPVKEETEIVTFEGFIGKPEFSKKSRGEQFIFVNDRFIKSNYLNHAVKTAFEGLIQDDAYPFYVLFMEIDPERIDVNVHPTKQEIKFQDERLIYNYLKVATRHALGQYSLSPIIDFDQERGFQNIVKGGAHSSPQGEHPGKAWQTLYEGLQKPSDHSNRPESSFPDGQTILKSWSGDSGVDEIPLENDVERVLFQIGMHYIVGPIKSGLMIVDSFAAQERILYEKYLASLDKGDSLVQKNLFPQTIECNPQDAMLLGEILPLIIKAGFDISEFGHGSFVIHGVPSIISQLGLNAEKVLFELITNYKTHSDDIGMNDRVARSLAKSSRRTQSKTYTREEMVSMIDQLFACESPFATPEGKRCFTTINIEELQNRFK